MNLPNTQNLIDWFPLKEELERERPLLSSYQSDFHSKGKVPQVLIHHQSQKQSLQRTPSTTYQHTYQSYYLGDPNLRMIKEQPAAKEPELEEPETTISASSEPNIPASSEANIPASSKPNIPASSKPTIPASSEASAADPKTAPVCGRSGFYLPPRVTVSDCLHWHNC